VGEEGEGVMFYDINMKRQSGNGWRFFYVENLKLMRPIVSGLILLTKVHLLKCHLKNRNVIKLKYQKDEIFSRNNFWKRSSKKV